MRDIGLFVWVVLLIVGVIGSMTSSIRRQREQAARRATDPRPVPAPTAPRPAPPQAVPGIPPGTGTQQATLVRVMQEIAAQQGPPARQRPPRPAPRMATPAAAAPPLQPAPHAVAAPPVKRRGFFGSGPELVRAVIAAEVLGKPRALNDEYY